MEYKILFIRLLFVSILAWSVNIQASDLAKEKRWADEVVDAIIDGEAVWLNDKKSDFLGIYTPAAENSGRAAIVMHGTGVHPNWQQVVQPLRVSLPEHKWILYRFRCQFCPTMLIILIMLFCMMKWHHG